MFRSVLLPQAVVVVVAQVLGGADPVLDDVVGRRVDHRLVRLPATRLRALAAVGGNDLRRKKKNRLKFNFAFFCVNWPNPASRCYSTLCFTKPQHDLGVFA
jgi:hypothetical protein